MASQNDKGGSSKRHPLSVLGYGLRHPRHAHPLTNWTLCMSLCILRLASCRRLAKEYHEGAWPSCSFMLYLGPDVVLKARLPAEGTEGSAWASGKRRWSVRPVAVGHPSQWGIRGTFPFPSLAGVVLQVIKPGRQGARVPSLHCGEVPSTKFDGTTTYVTHTSPWATGRQSIFFSHGAATMAPPLGNSSTSLASGGIDCVVLAVNTQHTTTKVPFMVQSGRSAVRSSRPRQSHLPSFRPRVQAAGFAHFTEISRHVVGHALPTTKPAIATFVHCIRAYVEVKTADMSRI